MIVEKGPRMVSLQKYPSRGGRTHREVIDPGGSRNGLCRSPVIIERCQLFPLATRPSRPRRLAILTLRSRRRHYVHRGDR